MAKRAKNEPVDVTALTKKYKCDINKVIRAWKADRSDAEISCSLGIDLLKLMQIRQDIEHAHLKDRQAKIKRRPPLF